MARIKLHEQAKRCIERLITDRALKPGSQLPTETNLASELYVSRTTIRNALKFLEQEGKIERTPGRGTIVRQHRWCLWRPDHAGFNSMSIFEGALVEE
jgi:DNA-binding GntR family transcriptional regulator